MIDARLLHTSNVPTEEARQIQDALARRVIAKTTWDPACVRTVAGVDVGFRDGMACAAAIVLRLLDLAPIEQARARLPISFPYVPGLLAFREGPAVLAALEHLQTRPDLVIFDSQGIAHPRRLGLASHIGVLLDWPTIGCAKSRLIGTFDEPGEEKGDWTLLHHEDETIGAVLRSRRGVKPIFVSPGHRIDLPTAVDFVLRCTMRYPLPETTRMAHRLADSSLCSE